MNHFRKINEQKAHYFNNLNISQPLHFTFSSEKDNSIIPYFSRVYKLSKMVVNVINIGFYPFRKRYLTYSAISKFCVFN